MGPRCSARRSRFTRTLWGRIARRPDWCESILGNPHVEEYMKRKMDRRDFLKAAGVGAGWGASVPAWAQRKRYVKIGHTGITWVQPPPPRPSVEGAAPAPPAGRGGGG